MTRRAAANIGLLPCLPAGRQGSVQPRGPAGSRRSACEHSLISMCATAASPGRYVQCYQNLTMKKSFYSFITISSFLFLISCKQSQEDPSTKYFRYVNNHQSDSLQALLTDDFEIRLTYTTYSYNRTD